MSNLQNPEDEQLDVVQVTPTQTPEAPAYVAANVPVDPELGKKAAVVMEDADGEIVLLVEDLNDNTPFDEFDWSLGKRAQRSYDVSLRESMLADFEQSLGGLNANEIVSARISAITAGDVVLDVSYKSDGLISLSEFRDTPDLMVGQMIDVYVERLEDADGRLVLSRRKAKLLRAWENIVGSFNNGTIIRGTVVSKTKGGLIVDAGGLETFLPGSQIDIKPIVDYDQYVGKQMDFKVVKINETIKNAVVSHKALIESDLAEQREFILSGLEKGQVLEGIVKNITDFGAFLDLGGVDGLLYITDISWGRVNHPSEALQLNQRINVVVLDFDENKKRISLGLKQLYSHPWEVLSADIVEGSTVRGKIVNIEDYGAFLEIQPGVEGLIHVSEVSWGSQNVAAKEFFKMGQELDAKVVTIDRDDRKMSLSTKQLTNDPWTEVGSRFAVGTRHTGTVRNITQYGIFIELEAGIGGMIHISDISWLKRFNHPNEFTKSGNTHEVVVLEVDADNRKLSLGLKQMEENPWEGLENIFPVGSYHQGAVVRRDDRGAIVMLPHNVEAFASLKQIRKEDGAFPNPDEQLTFKVVEFNQDDKRLTVSHTRYLEDIKKEADVSVRKEQDKETETVRKVVKEVQAKAQSNSNTLGDLDALNAMRDQLSGEDKK